MMDNRTIRLDVPYEKAGLSSEGCSAELDLYPIARHENIEITKRPAVIICPGGGYEYCSVREAEPIALRYAAFGVAAFFLRYSCVNKKFPTALLEVAQAMAYVRKNAEGLGVDPNKIMICGFSAGGHLAGNLAVHWNKSFITDALGGDKELYKPNGAVLCYPVITSGEKRHDGSIINIAGESPSAEMLETLALEKQVTKDTPPTFLWHTADDGCVPVENTLMFASALAANGIPFACHIFKEGGHGLALCDDTTAGFDGHINPDCARWFEMSVQWIKAL